MVEGIIRIILIGFLENQLHLQAASIWLEIDDSHTPKKNRLFLKFKFAKKIFDIFTSLLVFGWYYMVLAKYRKITHTKRKLVFQPSYASFREDNIFVDVLLIHMPYANLLSNPLEAEP